MCSWAPLADSLDLALTAVPHSARSPCRCRRFPLQVLSIYPSTLRRRILRHLYLPLLRSSYLFSGTPRKFLVRCHSPAAQLNILRRLLSRLLPCHRGCARWRGRVASTPQTPIIAAPIDDRPQDALLSSSRLELFKQGVDIVTAGDSANELYLIVAGSVEMR
jgi:hypothetical protein